MSRSCTLSFRPGCTVVGDLAGPKEEFQGCTAQAHARAGVAKGQGSAGGRRNRGRRRSDVCRKADQVLLDHGKRLGDIRRQHVEVLLGVGILASVGRDGSSGRWRGYFL